MPFFALYLVKLSISLGLVWLFYQLLLRRLTFYNWNRWYLLGYSLLSFLIPLIDIRSMVNKDNLSEPALFRYIPVIGNHSPLAPGAQATGGHPSTGLLGWSLLFVLLALVSAILILKLLVRWLSLQKIRRQATLISEAGDKLRVYQVDRPIIPFSFGNAVYINQQLHTEKEWEEIILHEFVHIRQRHTFDIVVAELLCAFNWYNPFAWLIRFSIRQNLEFIADGKVLENGVDRKGYQYHLLKVIGQPRYRLANSFNFSSLKKRIAMMNKIKSARLQLIKFLFMLPLLATLLVAFRGQYEGIFNRHSGSLYVNAAGIIIDIANYQPLSGVKVTDKRTGISSVTDERGFYKMQLTVDKDSIRVHLDLVKADYDSNMIEYFYPKIKEPMSSIEIGYLEKKDTHPAISIFMGYDNNPHPPLDPTYEDALKALIKVHRNNEDMENFFKMQKQHPEVSLFYTAEDHLKHIVFYQDGHYEKYGYPDGPTVADMEKKFGQLPEFITGKQGSAGGYYVEQWAKISAQAEKEFHTDNPDARHIIFPGDSRVIVVPVSGKPRIYDMDNGRDDKERPAFEREYGKLPACVPEPGKPASGLKERVRTDTVPLNTDASKDGPHRPVIMPMALSKIMDSARPEPLWVVDGKIVDSAKSRNIPPNTIYLVQVWKSSVDSLVRIYGDKAKNGVISITTKEHAPKPADIINRHTRVVTPESSFAGPVHITWVDDKPMPDMILDQNPGKNYIYLVDGKLIPVGTDMGKILRDRDLAGFESSGDMSTVFRFGGHSGQRVMNIITGSNKENPASYVLTYEKVDDSH